MIYFNSDIGVLLKFETMSSVNYVASFNLDAIQQQIGKLKIIIFMQECKNSLEKKIEQTLSPSNHTFKQSGVPLSLI